MSKTVANCPHCNAHVTGHIKLVGRRARCPKCSRRFTFQHASAQETLDPHGTTPAKTFDDVAPVVGVQAVKDAEKIGAIGRFRLLKVLGEGAFGRVYLAFDPQLDRAVALKVPTFSSVSKERVQRFLNEAKAAAQLRHPNIVPIFESGRIAGRYFIASQYIPGETLGAAIKSEKCSIEQAILWTISICDAVVYAHSQGVVHRDLKPDNIMLDAARSPQIMDFGLARRDAEDSNLTTDGSVMGTPAYMPPEQARGEVAQMGPASDQYSIGVILYELLAGRCPFVGEPHQVLIDVLEKEPRSLRLYNPDVPRDLEAIIAKAMCKDVKGRYSSVQILRNDLAAWRVGEPTVARPMGVVERSLRWYRRNAVISTLAAGVVVLLLIVASIATVGYLRVSALRETETALRESIQDALDREKQITREREAAQRLAEQKTLEAERSLAAANRERLKAEQAWLDAKEANRVAAANASEAERLKLQTQQEMDRATAARQALASAEADLSDSLDTSADLQRKLAQKNYRHLLESAILAKTREEAATILLQCHPKDRGWEWRFLHAQASRSKAYRESKSEKFTWYNVVASQSANVLFSNDGVLYLSPDLDLYEFRPIPKSRAYRDPVAASARGTLVFSVGYSRDIYQVFQWQGDQYKPYARIAKPAVGTDRHFKFVDGQLLALRGRELHQVWPDKKPLARIGEIGSFRAWVGNQLYFSTARTHSVIGIDGTLAKQVTHDEAFSGNFSSYKLQGYLSERGNLTVIARYSAPGTTGYKFGLLDGTTVRDIPLSPEAVCKLADRGRRLLLETPAGLSVFSTETLQRLVTIPFPRGIAGLVVADSQERVVIGLDTLMNESQMIIFDDLPDT